MDEFLHELGNCIVVTLFFIAIIGIFTYTAFVI